MPVEEGPAIFVDQLTPAEGPSPIVAEPTAVAAEPTAVAAEPTAVAAEPTAVAAEPTAVAAEPPAGPSLAAPDPEERRLAVAHMAGRGLSDEGVARVSSLVLDPDPGVRGLALGVLTERADSLDEERVHRALQDPADEVRAVAVRLVAARGPKELAHLTALIGARRWPQTQRTVLEMVPDLVSAHRRFGTRICRRSCPWSESSTRPRRTGNGTRSRSLDP